MPDEGNRFKGTNDGQMPHACGKTCVRGGSDCFLCLCDLAGLSPLTMLTFEADGACISDPCFCDMGNLRKVFHV